MLIYVKLDKLDLH